MNKLSYNSSKWYIKIARKIWYLYIPILFIKRNIFKIDYINYILEGFTSSEREKLIGRRLIKEIIERLAFMKDVGLGYLTLDRKAGTLSGGESQRIRLATQIGSGLVGVLYILDEPSIGLHQRDNKKLIKALKRLRDLGNTIIVIEHDEETMREADHIVISVRVPGFMAGE